jgi:hypothetical protein
MKRAILRLLVVLFLGSPAAADPVFVAASSEEQGHGWLFGAEWQGAVACWIAVPRHVVRERGGEGLLAFSFTTASGRSGDTAVPIWVGDVPGAVEAAAGQEDLAFARVSTGGGDCRSRLGPPDYAYATFMETIDLLSIWSMSPTSYGPFPARIDRATTASGGGLLRLSSVNAEQAKTFMSGGISGAVAQAERAGEPTPVAMILQVDPQTLSALALRFDRIRAAFALVAAAAEDAYREERADSDGLPITIDEAIGLPLPGRGGPTALLTGEQCFGMAPLGGQRTVDLLVSLSDAGDSTAGMALAAGECAAPGVRYVVEQRVRSTDAWSVVASCVTAATLPASPDCRFDLRAPRQFRLRVAASPVELAAIRFY